ncbi:cell division protein FtsQ [Actinomyces bovis]|uniref:Cell division protein FtsQ n=1 Tax=Actinomyces bovis TaxID=1658 RepID=A0ABY1VPT8_9ACTO|nr:FtsQ-type POTRA domain-containing protein [Actinomyces bovis]SPT53934.1 cell division protein FtsQ [Actinomyces bovis]VEG53433.1 cell division protein FtsQ [Actinomyces israelii]
MRKPSAPRPGAEEQPPAKPPAQKPSVTVSPDEGRTGRLPAVRQRAPQALETRGQRTEQVVSTGLEERLKERRNALSRLRRRRILLGLTVVLVLGLAGWAVLASPLLALKLEQVEVRGSDGTVSVEQVRQVYAPVAGFSLLRLDLDDLEVATARDLVRVRAARVSRAWPNGLVVRLEMREPVAVRQANGGYEVLDAEAVVLETVATPSPGLASVQAPAGQELSAEMVTAVVSAVGALDTQTRAQVSSGTASAAGQVTLTLQSGASVVWGDTSEPELKAQVLRTLLGTQAKVYDVSSPKYPATS